MTWHKDTKRDLLLGGGSLLFLTAAVLTSNMLALAGGAAGILLVAGRYVKRFWTLRNSPVNGQPPPIELSRALEEYGSGKPDTPRRRPRTVKHTTSRALVDDMIDEGRYALLLRMEVVGNLNEAQRRQVLEVLTSETTLITAGQVRLQTHCWGESNEKDDQYVTVPAIYMDRFAVTNAEYQQFVESGGYSSWDFWDPEIVDAVSQFVDRTGQSGPRLWRDGRYVRGTAHHPVVGVNWYEACAYARWVGKRLPTDPEWVRAASSPVPSANNQLQQRRFPWGNAVEDGRANLWSAGMGKTVPVAEFALGDTIGGARQMVGNVWEWTADDFERWFAYPGADQHRLNLKGLRGGAFDTYFENQANSQFHSGDHHLSRKHNIGFRCALSVDDVDPAFAAAQQVAGAGAPGAASPTGNGNGAEAARENGAARSN